MLTWANLGLALVRLLTAVLSFIERERQLHLGRQQQAEAQRQADEKDKLEAQRLDIVYDRMPPIDRERLRDEHKLYRD